MAKYERLFQNECRTKEKKWGGGGGGRKKKKNREDPSESDFRPRIIIKRLAAEKPRGIIMLNRSID